MENEKTLYMTEDILLSSINEPDKIKELIIIMAERIMDTYNHDINEREKFISSGVNSAINKVSNYDKNKHGKIFTYLTKEIKRGVRKQYHKSVFIAKTLSEVEIEIEVLKGIGDESPTAESYIKIAEACEEHYNAKVVQIFIPPSNTESKVFIVMRKNKYNY